MTDRPYDDAFLADVLLPQESGPPEPSEEEPVDPAPAAWVDMGTGQARAALEELTAWMGRVLVHHPRTLDRLRPCWYRHPAAVQALLDTAAAWRRAYRGGGDTWWALQWWQSTLPHLGEVLAAELAHCTSVRHDPDRGALPRPGAGEVEAYLAWWGSGRADPPPAAADRDRSGR